MAVPIKRNERGVIRWDPIREMREMERRFQGGLGELFDWRTFPLLRALTPGEEYWSPAVEVIDHPDKFLVRTELPGMRIEDIDVSVRENTLFITGERKEDKKVKDEDYLYREHFYGSFCRTIPLPSTVKEDKIEAHYEDGILEVTVPKSEETKPKKIPISTKTEKK